MRTNFCALSMSLLVAATACEVVGEDEELDEIEATVPITEVARYTGAQGDLWRFLEAEPGELFLWATATGTNPDLVQVQTSDQPSYVELYQRLALKPAPRALLDAQARADALADEEEESEDQSGLVNEEGRWASRDGRLTQAISATDFQDTYCNATLDFSYCWPSFYGSPYVQRKTYSIWGYVAAVNDTVDFRLRYKKHWYSSWSTLVSAQALPGQVHGIYTSYYGYRRWRRWEVLDHGDDLLRYSCFGDD